MKRLLNWCAIVSLATSTLSAQELERTLAYLPDAINAVAVVRVREVLDSPRGKREGWGKQPQSQFLAGALEAGADVQLIVRGMEFHPEDLRVIHTVGLVTYARSISLTQLAKREGGHVDKLADKSAVHTPHQGFYVAFEPRVLGTIEPSYRQNVARWIRQVAQRTEPKMSPYLLEAARSANAHVVLALDVADMVDPRLMRERLASFSLLIGDDRERESVARLLEQMRGIRAAVTVTDQIEAEVAVDFAIHPSPKLAEYIRPLLSEILSRSGAMIDEIDQAKTRLDGKSVVLSMSLSDSSARQMLSLAFASMTGVDVPVEETVVSTETANTARTIAATKNYVASVNRLVDDLQAKNARARDYQRTASWHETYAKRIDQLPVRDVDSAALKYAAGVSSKLRALAVSLRGVPLTVNRLQNSITWSTEYTPWAVGFNIWGGVGYRPPNWQFQTNQGEIQAQQAQAIADGEQTRYEVWKMLADDRQALRIALREKYNIDVE
jgi:hypothetical protein